ncbi:MAG TPA: T9SS type A sorting domain-containing protein [Bacteroidetes bacterium]|nr:T9SS type A sorting domain-containing protein [Bacteroidota bacterium]
MKNKTIFLIFLTFTFFMFQMRSLNAQSLSQHMISSSEHEYTSASGVQSVWTLGDFMTEYIGNNNKATQGFLQAELWYISSIYPLSKINAKIYPNPASSYFNIELPENDFFNIRLINNLGKTILEAQNITRLHRLDISGLIPQTYFLIIENKNSKSHSSFKLVHIK